MTTARMYWHLWLKRVAVKKYNLDPAELEDPIAVEFASYFGTTLVQQLEVLKKAEQYYKDQAESWHKMFDGLVLIRDQFVERCDELVKDAEANERDWSTLAAELKVEEPTREEIVKKIRQLVAGLEDKI